MSVCLIALHHYRIILEAVASDALGCACYGPSILQNVLLTGDGLTAKLVDAGLARMMGNGSIRAGELAFADH